MLHVTNGDSVAGTLPKTGPVVVWRDVLHEGPVPAGLELEELSRVRAEFINRHFEVPSDEVARQFRERDQLLASFREHEEVCLWFEHDLYDQLQILQVLDFFASVDLGATQLTIICVDSFPGVEPFYGLGQLNSDQLASLWDTREPVLDEQLDLARRMWMGFRDPNPVTLLDLTFGDLSALPFLRPAIKRWFEEFPSAHNGLCRIEQQILEAVLAGASSKVEIFRAHYAKEDAPFLGDGSCFLLIDGLVRGGALQRGRDEHRLTEFGRQLLDHEADWITTRKDYDRWLGGVHLQYPQNIWRWYSEKFAFVPPALPDSQ